VRLSRFGASAAEAQIRMTFAQRHGHFLPYDFVYGRSDLTTFPFEMWRRILLRCARKASAAKLNYGVAGGDLALREAICTHLQRSRAVASDPSQILVVNGSQQALDLIARVLIEPGDRVVIEDPGYQGTPDTKGRGRSCEVRVHSCFPQQSIRMD
jgi:GntR family transcriptional regulator/MocR family aminotransferase